MELAGIMDILVVGGGPAGLSAAVNARRRNKRVGVIGKEVMSSKLWQAHRIENYLGIPGVSGQELANAMRNYAEAEGVELIRDEIQNILFADQLFTAMGREGQYMARSVILGIGVVQEAGIAGEERLVGRGVSYCATCDGMFFKGKRVAMISYIPDGEEEARFLAEICGHVVYMPQYNLRQITDPRIEVLKAKPLEITGEQKVEGLRTADGVIPVEGVFIERPSVSIARLLPDLKVEDGVIVVDREMCTNLPGVFAAGDCVGKPWQIGKAVGEGQIAALSAVKYLESLPG